ncbi:MAG TPA: DUF11 domain-containing protein [Chloroflexia bacterium]|nr:DUF11 domain-containing protein [Chloroflexia bacterium]
MKLQVLKRIAPFSLPAFIVSGLLGLALVASFQLSWGTAYGQTAGSGDISITKTVSPTSIFPGQTVTFTIRVINNSATTTYNNVIVTDNMPGQFDVISATASKGTVRITGQRVVIQIDSLAPQELVEITIVTQARAGAGRGPVTNNVDLKAADPSGNPVAQSAFAEAVLSEAGSPEGQPPVIPGLPNTGSQAVANNPATIPAWKLIALGLLGTVMLASAATMFLNRRGKVGE